MFHQGPFWNEDTEPLYPDLDRDRRLDAVRHGRYGGWTVDSLRRERQRRAEYFARHPPEPKRPVTLRREEIE